VGTAAAGTGTAAYAPVARAQQQWRQQQGQQGQQQWRQGQQQWRQQQGSAWRTATAGRDDSDSSGAYLVRRAERERSGWAHTGGGNRPAYKTR
jgi:hypothetical protein